jgi:hypothetical protein
VIPTVDYRAYSRYPSRDIGHIPGDSGAPLIGDTLHFLRDLKGLTGEKYRRYGSVFRVNTFFQHTIVMLGPQANEAVLKDSAHYFSNALAWNPTLDRIFPNGLMLKDFDDHKHDRRVLQAAFRRSAIVASRSTSTSRNSCYRRRPLFSWVLTLALNLRASIAHLSMLLMPLSPY